MSTSVFSMKINSTKTDYFNIKRFFKSDFGNFENFEKKGDYAIGYVSSEDLSFHNFENIIRYDNFCFNISLKQKQLTEIDPGIYKIQSKIHDELLTLDKLDLYTIPSNHSTRGGSRLIFQSEKLTDIITNMLSSLNGTIFDKFKRCNLIFRLNKFIPGDADFKTHYDTPYVNRTDNEYSKYTILIYLSDCYNENGLLNFGDFSINSISKGDIFIFDQQLEHSGSAPTEGNKIFIRSELIYDGLNEFQEDPIASSLFNKACYLQKEAIKTDSDEIQNFSSELFNRAILVRKRIYCNSLKTMMFFKKYKKCCYITDGNNYYFLDNGNSFFLKYIAGIVIKDYFDHIKGNKIILENESNDAIFTMLKNFSLSQSSYESMEKLSDIIKDNDKFAEIATYESKAHCWFGPDECGGMVIVREYQEELEKERKLLEKETKGFTCAENMYDCYVNMEDMEIKNNEIIVSNIKMPEINFASCQCSWDDISIEGTGYKIQKNLYGGKAIALPNIKFKKVIFYFDEKPYFGYVLSLDIFQNSFIYSKNIDIPNIYTVKEK